MDTTGLDPHSGKSHIMWQVGDIGSGWIVSVMLNTLSNYLLGQSVRKFSNDWLNMPCDSSGSPHLHDDSSGYPHHHGATIETANIFNLI